jgi:PKD repeat protein
MSIMHKFKNIVAIIFIVSLIVSASCKKDDKNDDPVAAFTWEQTTNPGEIVFKNNSKNASIYSWNFGNGKSSTATNPTHVYDQNDSYIVTLSATGKGLTVSVKDTIVVNNIP